MSQQTSPFESSESIATALSIVESNIACSAVTILKFDKNLSRAHRIYTSSSRFPQSGSKPLPSDIWKETIVIQKQPMLTSGETQLQAVFPDYSQIMRGGHIAVLNLPVIHDEECIGSVNCLFSSDEAILPSKRQIKSAQIALNSSSFPMALKQIDEFASRSG